jgi:hypothetical protein
MGGRHSFPIAPPCPTSKTMPDPSIWPFPPFRHTPRGDDASAPPALWKPVEVAVRRSAAGFARTSSFGSATHDLAPIFTSLSPQVGPRPFRDRLGQRQVADQGLHIRASIDGHAETWRAGVYPGTPCPARPIPGIARRNSNVRRWAGPLL